MVPLLRSGSGGVPRFGKKGLPTLQNFRIYRIRLLLRCCAPRILENNQRKKTA